MKLPKHLVNVGLAWDVVIITAWFVVIAPDLHAEPVDPLDEARAHHMAGRWQEALDAYRVIAEGGDPPSAAIAYNNACNVHNTLGEYPAALEECREALRLRRELGDEPRTARTLNNLAVALRYLGRFDEATATYREALAINERHGDAQAQAINRQNLGAVAIEAGRYGEALTLFQSAATLAETHAEEPWATEQARLAQVNRGVVLEKLGAYREALEIYRGLADAKDEIEPVYWASLQVNLGVMYRNLGDPVRAVQSFEEAGATYERLGDTAALSNATLNLGLAWHLDLGRPADAEAAYRKALELAERSGDLGEEIQDLFHLGRLLLDLRREDEAEAVFSRCLQAADAAGSPEGQWSALYGLGRAATAGDDLPGALEYFERAIDRIEAVRADLDAGTLRSGYFGDKRPVYAAAVGVLAELAAADPGADYAGQALELVQRTKARELLENLGGAGSPGGAEDAIRRPQPLTVEELVGSVGEAPVLEYFLGDGTLFLWLISREGVELLDLGPSESILQQALEVHRELAAGRQPPPAVLEALSGALLSGALPSGALPSVAHEALNAASRLRIAPDGGLHYLPFELLLFPEEGVSGSLIDRFEISYLPSASALAWLTPREERAELTLAGFADPRRARVDSDADPVRQRLTSGFDLPALPAAARELTAISRLLPGDSDLHTGEEATEDAFRRSAANGARIIHLATHTVVDERPGQGAGILLSPTATDDGLLRPSEIAGLEVRAELTVLAACRSALGGAEDGRAFASLTGSLLAAGSSGVVASLWDVGDEASAAFMEQFYYRLSRGESPATALRQAKLRMRSDPTWNRPEIWAAYVLIGEVPSLMKAGGVPRWAWLAAAGLACLAILRGVRGRSQRGFSRGTEH